MNGRAVVLAIMFATIAVGISRAQQANNPQSLENQIAMQLGQCSLAIARGNAVIVDLQKQIADLKTKCGKPCEDTKTDVPGKTN